jgi:hypothetical protein|nr:MAG TPA: Protein of unknown function (DUF1492) [Caudoviricetes sp.]
MKAEYFLRSYATFTLYRLQAETELKKLKDERDAIYAEGTPPDGQPRSSDTGNPTAKIVEKLVRYDRKIARIEAEIATYDARMQCIEDVVSRLAPDEQQIAQLRYMRMKPLRWDEIARETHFSVSHCYRINQRVLQKIKKMRVDSGYNMIY